jgi:hypothetical protein
MVDNKKAQALDDLSSINGQITRVINAVVSGSKSIAAQNSTVVAGVFGGFCGLSGAYLITSFVATLSFPILGPLFTGLGIAAGVLFFRRANLGAESDAARGQIALDENERIAKVILARIQKLPKNAPVEVRQELWTQYALVAKELAQLASSSPNGKIALPSPTTQSVQPVPVP